MAVIRTVPGTSSAYAERAIGGYYLNVDPDRAQLARYGLMVGDVQSVIVMAPLRQLAVASFDPQACSGVRMIRPTWAWASKIRWPTAASESGNTA